MARRGVAGRWWGIEPVDVNPRRRRPARTRATHQGRSGHHLAAAGQRRPGPPAPRRPGPVREAEGASPGGQATVGVRRRETRRRCRRWSGLAPRDLPPPPGPVVDRAPLIVAPRSRTGPGFETWWAGQVRCRARDVLLVEQRGARTRAGGRHTRRSGPHPCSAASTVAPAGCLVEVQWSRSLMSPEPVCTCTRWSEALCCWTSTSLSPEEVCESTAYA